MRLLRQLRLLLCIQSGTRAEGIGHAPKVCEMQWCQWSERLDGRLEVWNLQALKRWLTMRCNAHAKNSHVLSPRLKKAVLPSARHARVFSTRSAKLPSSVESRPGRDEADVK